MNKKDMVSIEGLDKADVLLALWNHAQMQGLSFLAFTGELTKAAAENAISEHTHTGMDGEPRIYFDYLNGKVLKVDIAKDEFDPYLYDRDNGIGSAQRAIDLLYQEVTAQRIADDMPVSRDMLEKAKIIPPRPTTRARRIDIRIEFAYLNSGTRCNWTTTAEIPAGDRNSKKVIQAALDTFYQRYPDADIIAVHVLD